MNPTLLPCPLCGENETCVKLHLDDMETFECGSCGEQFAREDVSNFISKWSRVLAWLDASRKSKEG